RDALGAPSGTCTPAGRARGRPPPAPSRVAAHPHPPRARPLMERVDGVGGVFFRARDPERLLAWYREHLGVDPAPDFHGQEFEGGPTVWALFPADTDYFGRSEERRVGKECRYRWSP